MQRAFIVGQPPKLPSRLGFPHAEAASFGKRQGGEAAAIRAERTGTDTRFFCHHLAQRWTRVERLLDANAVDGFLAGLVTYQRQRISEPQQRAGWVFLIKETDTVRDIQPDQALTVLLSYF